MKDFITTLPGLTPFGRVPTQTMIDPAIGPRHFLVYSVLASHAKDDGTLGVNQARIAEMCGFYVKGKPDNALISKLISNPGFKTQKTGTGAGLVELGYVKKYKQKGLNMIKTYSICVPPVEGDSVIRPDGSRSTLRIPTNRQRLSYKDEKNVERENYEKAQIENDIDMCEIDGCIYFKDDIFRDISFYNDGLELDIPESIYTKFGIKRPTSRN